MLHRNLKQKLVQSLNSAIEYSYNLQVTSNVQDVSFLHVFTLGLVAIHLIVEFKSFFVGVNRSIDDEMFLFVNSCRIKDISIILRENGRYFVVLWLKCYTISIFYLDETV